MTTFQLSKKQYVLWSGILLAALLFLLQAGCSSTKQTATQGANGMSTTYDPKPVDPPSAQANIAKGQKVFETVGCMGCHAVNGKGGSVGPNLSNEGDKGKSRQWLTTQIENPRTNDPDTIMPAFGNLSKEQVSDLVDYLMSLRGKSSSSGGPQNTSSAIGTSSNGSLSEAGRMWSDTCGRCHNLRPPDEYSDAQWAAAMDQMHLLIPLTGDERKEILKFLQASN